MKRSLFVSLSALTLSLVTAPTFASTVAAVNSSSTNNIVEISPVDLVNRGYQGFLSDRGIPSNGAFNRAVYRGKITAQDLVNGAIAAGRLAPETINDRAYLNRVNSQLRNLNNN